MNQLLRKTIELLRENPILFLPYLVAELLAVGLWRLWGMVRQSVFQWFTTSHSVLGGDIPNTDHSALRNASTLSLPIGLVTVFAVVCLFVVALMMTASMVDANSRKELIDLRKIVIGLVPRWRRGLLFSVAFLLAIGASLAVFTTLLFFVLDLLHRPNLRTSPFLNLGVPFLYVGCAGWLVMPMAIRLLRKDSTVKVSSRTRSLGTIATILATEAGVSLGMILQKAETRVLLDTQLDLTMLSIVNSVVANAPDVLAFTFLAVLATENSEEAESKEVTGIQDWLQILMPMHFRRTKEPD